MDNRIETLEQQTIKPTQTLKELTPEQKFEQSGGVYWFQKIDPRRDQGDYQRELEKIRHEMYNDRIGVPRGPDLPR